MGPAARGRADHRCSLRWPTCHCCTPKLPLLMPKLSQPRIVPRVVRLAWLQQQAHHSPGLQPPCSALLPALPPLHRAGARGAGAVREDHREEAGHPQRQVGSGW